MIDAYVPASGDDGTTFESVSASVTQDTDSVTIEGVIDGRFETWDYETLPGDVLPEPIRGILQDTPIHDGEMVIQVRRVETGEDPPSAVTSESGNWVLMRDE